MKSISRIVHHHHQSPFVTRDQLNPPPHLPNIGRRKDIPAYRRVEQTVAYEAGMGGLMSGSTAREEGDAGLGRGGFVDDY